MTRCTLSAPCPSPRISLHKWTGQLAVLTCLLWCAHLAQGEDLADLVAGPVELVVPDCAFTEGPAWHPGGFLLFSDIPNERIIRLNPDGSYTDWFTNSGRANGLICDQSGAVYACQGSARQVSRLAGSETGSIVAILADGYDNLPLNQPNDLALDGQGGLYFTDPMYSPDPPPQPVQGVYYVSSTREITRVIDNLPRPNGVLVTEDGKHLLVANIDHREIIRYDILEPGQLSEGEVLFKGDEALDGNGPDGMALDADGRIYATYKSLVVLTPAGDLIGRIEVPERPANCTFGGESGRTLYITARTSLYAVEMHVAGVPLMERGPAGKPVASEPVETREVEALDIRLQVPVTWIEQSPSSNLRLLQFEITSVEEGGEASEYVVFPPFGGSREENIRRWIDQFEAGGRQLSMAQGQCAQGQYVIVDLTGTYKKPDGPPVRMQTVPAPGYRMLAAILSTEKGNYFLKMVGPAATIDLQVEAFRNSFGADPARESEFTLN